MLNMEVMISRILRLSFNRYKNYNRVLLRITRLASKMKIEDNNMKKLMKRIIVTLISILLILAVLALTAITGFMKWNDYKDDQILKMNKFDQALWLDENRDSDNTRPHHYSGCVRGEMYYDLVENYLRIGMTKEEVFALLGRPDSRRKYKDNKKRHNCYRYDLGEGHCSLSSGPTKIMLVCLKDNRVVDVFTSTANDKGETFLIDGENER